MSHFLAYRGPEVVLAKLLHLPHESFICYTKNNEKLPVHSDGFGIGWYNRSLSRFPATYKTIRTALNDDNLINFTSTIQSKSIFMHQLNIDDSYSAQQVNCQPFTYKSLMFMHIGTMSTFHLSKKALIKEIHHTAFDLIKGHSVSEYIFAFFLSQLDLKSDKYTQQEIENALQITVDKLTKICRKIDRRYQLSLNIAVTDENHFLALRYMDDFKKKPEPMYYTVGDSIEIINGNIAIKRQNKRQKFVMISSKPLFQQEIDWKEIPENHLVNISSLNNVSTKAII